MENYDFGKDQIWDSDIISLLISTAISDLHCYCHYLFD